MDGSRWIKDAVHWSRVLLLLCGCMLAVWRVQCARRPFGTHPVLTGCRNGCGGAVGGVSMLLCRDVAKLFLRARACSETHNTHRERDDYSLGVHRNTHAVGCCQCFVLFCGDSSLRTANLYRTYIPAAINTHTQPPSLQRSLFSPTDSSCGSQHNHGRNKARGFTETQVLHLLSISARSLRLSPPRTSKTPRHLEAFDSPALSQSHFQVWPSDPETFQCQ